MNIKKFNSIFKFSIIILLCLTSTGCNQNKTKESDSDLPTYVSYYEQLIYDFYTTQKNLEDVSEIKSHLQDNTKVTISSTNFKDALIKDLNADGSPELILVESYENIDYFSADDSNPIDMNSIPTKLISLQVFDNKNLVFEDTSFSSEYQSRADDYSLFISNKKNTNEWTIGLNFENSIYQSTALLYLKAKDIAFQEKFSADFYELSPKYSVNQTAADEATYQKFLNEFNDLYLENMVSIPRKNINIESVIDELYSPFGNYKELTSVIPISTMPSEKYTDSLVISFKNYTGEIYYTLDGSVPTTSSIKYDSPIDISTTTTLKAITLNPLGNPSTVSVWNYTIDEKPSNSAQNQIVENIQNQDLIDKASVFLSNFAEQNMQSFNIEQLSDYDKIQYSLNQIYLNAIHSTSYKNCYKIESASNSNTTYDKFIINKKYIDKVSARYLNSNIKTHQAIDSNFNIKYTPSTQSYSMDVIHEYRDYSCAKVTSLSLRTDGFYFIEADEYAAYKSFFTAPLIRQSIESLKNEFSDFKRLGKIEAIASFDGTNFKIIDYKYISRPPYLIQSNASTKNTLILDAINAKPIPGVTMNFRKGKNSQSEEIIYSIITNNDGTYNLSGLNPGFYTIETSKSGYITNYYNVYFDGNFFDKDFQIALSPPIGLNDMRIVLTWGENPSDLDSHIIGPDNSYHVYYNNPSNNDVSTFLDVDDTSSFGPETITIKNISSGTYKYFIHDFTNKHFDNSTALSHSNASVAIYSGNNLVELFDITQNNSGTIWNVFDIVDGKIILNNSFTNSYGFYEDSNY